VKRSSPAFRRLFTVLATATIGVLAALAFASPASAWSGSVHGSSECQSASGTFLVTWKIKNDYGAAEAFIKSFTVTPDTPVTAGGTAIGVGTTIAAGASITGTQVVPGDTATVTLTVVFGWQGSTETFTAYGKVTPNDMCTKPSSPPPPPASSPPASVPPVATSASASVGASTSASTGVGASAGVSSTPVGGTGGGSGLPVTGVSGIAFAGVALALIGGGTALVLLGRRRRSTP
jgi:hypothetical protein